jgi:hypothetical protein
MAGLYAEKYGLLRTAGSDNHYGQNVFARLREKGFRPELAGMCSDTEVSSVSDFISKVRAGEMKIFSMTEDGEVSVR